MLFYFFIIIQITFLVAMGFFTVSLCPLLLFTFNFRELFIIITKDLFVRAVKSNGFIIV